MKRQDCLRTMVAVLMSAVFILPAMAWSAEKSKTQEIVLETSKTTIGSEAINQEVIQILRKGEMAKVTMNIAGQPGVYYKVEYSETGLDKSYKVLPKGTGVIGSNGFGSVSFDLRKLGKEEVYLKVTASDTKDFAKPRVMPKPLMFLVDQVKIKDRNALGDAYNKAYEKIRDEVRERIDTTPQRNNNAGSVRG